MLAGKVGKNDNEWKFIFKQYQCSIHFGLVGKFIRKRPWVSTNDLGIKNYWTVIECTSNFTLSWVITQNFHTSYLKSICPIKAVSDHSKS